MDAKKFNEKDIHKALSNNTEVSPRAKEEIWKNIDNELFSEKRSSKPGAARKRGGLIKYALSAAAVTMLIIGFQTDTSHALINHIREMFVPEKEITRDIEGLEEKGPVQLQEGDKSAYVIYVDEERYRLINENGVDKIIPGEPLGDIYPEVSMEIKQVGNKKPETLIEEIVAQLKAEFADVTAPQIVEDPVSGWTARGLEGMEWDSKLVRVYVVENRKEGSFVITQRYFLEAEEGHGARFDHMLKEFYIVDKPDS